MKQINWNRAIEAPPEQFHARMQSVLNALPEQEDTAMKKTWSIKRIGALAVAAVLVLSIGVAAGNSLGYIRSDWHNTSSLKDSDAVVEVLESEQVEGLTSDAKFLEGYSNGFTFAGAALEGSESRADGNATVYHYQSVSAWYERDGAKVYVYISPLIEGVTDILNGSAVECGDVTLYTMEQAYKIVPEGYEPTEEETAAEAAGELVFSWDGDLNEPETMEQRYVSWIQDGMRYSINHIESQVPLDELVAMARELVNS